MSAGAMALLLLGGGLGAAAGRLVRLPMWPLTGALIGGAVVHIAAGGQLSVPTWWSTSAQVLVGAAVGATIVPGIGRQFRAVLLPGLVAVTSIIGVGVVCGLLIATTGRVDSVVAVFGMVPGGVGEMVAAATALNADSAVVAGMHVVRLLAVLSVLPVLVRVARWLARGQGPGGPTEESGGGDAT